MNGLNKRRKATSVSAFDFSTMYTKLPDNKLLMLALRSSARLLVFLWGLIQLFFFFNLFLYFYESKWMNKLKKNDLIKARKVCNIFRFINDLNHINDVGELESSYSNIYAEEIQSVKGNADKHEASLLDSDIKIKDGKFHFDLFNKKDSFPFSIARMPDKSSNVPSSIVYSAIGAESLRIARASNNPESFSTAIKPLIARMSRQGVSLEK